MDAILPHANGQAERRKDPARVKISLAGRYMLVGSKGEYECHTYEMSADEASLFAPVVSTVGARVVIYLSELGRLTGSISRLTEIGFDMSLQLTPRKREKLAGQLAWRVNRHEAKDRRRHERIKPENEISILTLPNGDEHVVRIRSLSTSGVALDSEHDVRIGDEVLIGATAAKVVRVRDGEIACQFLRPLTHVDPATRL
ncbi:PilZ domain-containing protein [Methylocystis echinoides]|uniref:PilZ domain-containing protein n=1 Tax=Methylocystis echinoides TaxID=29468 RepID=UPI0034167A66